MTTLRLFVLFSVLLLPSTVALATSNYQYGPDECVTVSNGISPDGKFAITAHGGGELGYDDFHLYLTNAITGKKIGPLEEIKETLVSYGIADRRARRIHGPYDVKSKDLIKYWQSYGSGGSASPKIFGTPLKRD